MLRIINLTPSYVQNPRNNSCSMPRFVRLCRDQINNNNEIVLQMYLSNVYAVR